MTRWAILRTSPAQTLPLMRSLRDAGFEVWSPARTIRRVLYPGRKAERRDEIDVPILPTFVFAKEEHFEALCELADVQSVLHPAFSVFARYDRSPMIKDREIVGLREEEERAGETMRAIRAAETHQAAEEIRIAAIKSDAARRRATKALERAKLTGLRAQPVRVTPGAMVDIIEMPALEGVSGMVEQVKGPHAWVRFGTLSWKVDGWRLTPSTSDNTAFRGLAA